MQKVNQDIKKIMKFPSDIEIAQKNEMSHIKTIASKLDIDADDLEYYGKYKAKLPLNLIDEEKVEQVNARMLN